MHFGHWCCLELMCSSNLENFFDCLPAEWLHAIAKTYIQNVRNKLSLTFSDRNADPSMLSLRHSPEHTYIICLENNIERNSYWKKRLMNKVSTVEENIDIVD